MRALTIALCLLATPARADGAGVAAVIDGDTIEVHGQCVRLHGIDAPEGRQLCRLDGKPWQCGKDAQATRRGIWAGDFVKPWQWHQGKRLDTGN